MLTVTSRHKTPTLVRPDVPTVQYFLETLYSQAERGYLVLSSPSPTRKRPDGVPCLDSEWWNIACNPWSQIAREAAHHAYFGVILQERCDPGQFRSKNTTAFVAPSLWADIDIATGDHKHTALPGSQAEAVAFLASLQRRPSLIVDTVGGVHAHWVFREPFVMTNAAERADFAHLSKRFTITLARLAEEAHGWKLDRLGDLARVLRCPGTITSKYQQRVRLLDESGAWYNPVQDFDDWLDALPTPAATPGLALRIGGTLSIESVAAHYQLKLATKSNSELVGPHPVHGSSTGSNFNLNPDKGLWHCWRCGTGGDAYTLLAVCAELIGCEQARPGALAGSRFRQVLALARDIFGAHPPLRLRATREVPKWF